MTAPEGQTVVDARAKGDARTPVPGLELRAVHANAAAQHVDEGKEWAFGEAVDRAALGGVDALIAEVS